MRHRGFIRTRVSFRRGGRLSPHFHARDEIPMKCHAAPFEIICVRAESDVTRDFRASRKNRRCFTGQVEGEKSGAVGADRIFPAHDAHRASNILSSGWRGCARAS